MNKIKSALRLLGFAMLFPGFLLAQENIDESLPKWQQKGFKSERQDMLMVDLNFERLTNVPDFLNQRFLSRGISIYLMYDYILGKSNFSLAAGAAWSSQHIFTNGSLVKDSAAGPTYFRQIPNAVDFTKNKMVTNYLELPFEIRYRTTANSKGHSWKISLLGRVGTLIDVHSKFVDDSGKYKNFIFPDVNNLRLGAGLRIGYGKASLHMLRTITPYLNDGSGRFMNTYSFGVNIALF